MKVRHIDMQVCDDGTWFHHNSSSQLSGGDTKIRRGETTLDNGCNLTIVGICNLTIVCIQLRNSGYAT
jgi:hypothetical protein